MSKLPGGVELVAAAKMRSPEEILEAVEAGVKIVGENYFFSHFEIRWSYTFGGFIFNKEEKGKGYERHQNEPS